jgi:rhodanese-related sulfurtransferase
MKAVRQALVILALSVGAAVATHRWHPQAPAWYVEDETPADGEVSMSQVREQWNGDVLWIDARTRERYNADHIPGALLLNEYERDDLLLEHLDKLQTSGKPIIVYCDAMKCEASHVIRTFLTENVGLPDVWVLTGGWPAWKGE